MTAQPTNDDANDDLTGVPLTVYTDEAIADARKQAIADLDFHAKKGREDSHKRNKISTDMHVLAVRAERVAKIMQYQMGPELSSSNHDAAMLAATFEKAFREVEERYHQLEGRKIQGGDKHRRLVLRYLEQHWHLGDDLGKIFEEELQSVSGISTLYKTQKLPMASEAGPLTAEEIQKFLGSKEPDQISSFSELLGTLTDRQLEHAMKAVRLCVVYRENLHIEPGMSPEKSAAAVNEALDKAAKTVFKKGDRQRIGVPVLRFMREHGQSELAELFGAEFKKTHQQKARKIRGAEDDNHDRHEGEPSRF